MGGKCSLVWSIQGRATGQGMVFGLSVLNRVYIFSTYTPKHGLSVPPLGLSVSMIPSSIMAAALVSGKFNLVVLVKVERLRKKAFSSPGRAVGVGPIATSSKNSPDYRNSSKRNPYKLYAPHDTKNCFYSEHRIDGSGRLA